ncbi:MAG: peptidoglycan DD-metalloendopeptidase family protein [Salinivirgaceae bacterium]
MNNFWEYLFLVSIGFTFLYVFFWLFYRKKTFHRVNRLVLLFILISSLLIPNLELPQNSLLALNPSVAFEWKNIELWADSFSTEPVAPNQNPVCWLLVLKMLYLIGVSIFSLRFLNQLIRLIRLRLRSSTKKSASQVLVYTKNKITPFSFFYWIFLPEDEFAHIDKHPIIEHERTHAQQWHSIDLLFTEIFSIFLWFVPFVYSFKNSIKSVHEYLADSRTIQYHSNLIDYLKLLASDTEKYNLTGLSNNFYCKTLKNRITMITKSKSTPISKIQYLLILPALAVMTIACSNFDKNIEPKKNKIDSLEDSSITDVYHRKFVLPIEGSKCSLSSGFGMRYHPIKKMEMMHNGIDFKSETRTPVVAVADGVVIKKEFQKDTYGNVVVIEHANGLVTLYAQLSEFKTELGQSVYQGQEIGLVGSSGMSTGPHLHFEVRKEGEFVNPADYLPIVVSPIF